LSNASDSVLLREPSKGSKSSEGSKGEFSFSLETLRTDFYQLKLESRANYFFVVQASPPHHTPPPIKIG
jgi:hypothetical protein